MGDQEKEDQREVIGADELSEAELRRRLEDIVQKSIIEDELITQNMYKYVVADTWVDRVSDSIASFSGSWTFIFAVTSFICAWMFWGGKYDPYPYILLNLIISVLCVMQTPYVMMSMVRKEERDRKRSEQEYIIASKAEIQTRSLLKTQEIIMEQLKKINEKLKERDKI